MEVRSAAFDEEQVMITGQVHLGLALPRMWPTNGSEAFAAFASFQMQVLKDLWRVFGNYSRSSWKVRALFTSSL